MTYEESANLIQNPQFRGRIKVAALRYADSIFNQPFGPGSNGRIRWANQVFQNPDQIAQSIQGPVVMDGGVQQWGADINDSSLQAAVEAVVNKTL